MPPVEQNPTPCPRSVTNLCIIFFLLFAGTADPAFTDNVDSVLRDLPVPEHIVGAGAVSRLQAFDRTGVVMRTGAVSMEGIPFVQAREIEITGTAKYGQWRVGGGVHGGMEGEHLLGFLKAGRARRIPMWSYVYHEYGGVRLDGWVKLTKRFGELFF